MHRPTWGECNGQAPGSLSCSDWEGHKMRAQPSLHLRGVPENLNPSGVDLGSACNPWPVLDSSPAEQPGALAVLTEKAHTP